MLKGPSLLAVALFSAACARAPSPLLPVLSGSIGLPHHGCLTGAAEIPSAGSGFRFLRDNDRHYGIARFAAALERAAAAVAEERPGAILVFGDLSTARGGQLLPHLSHRTGRDADILLYATTLDGAPVESPGFIHFGPDGLAWDEVHRRFLRFDVEREWILVKSLLEDPEARVQWIFSNHAIEALLIEWAQARGEPAELVWRAAEILYEPRPGGAHDDHVHVRSACSDDDVVHGCEPSGPLRPWLTPASQPGDVAPIEALARELLSPLVARDKEQQLSVTP